MTEYWYPNPLISPDEQGLITFTSGEAVTAGSYQIGRDTSGTNRIVFNVPTGASFAWMIQGADELLLNATNFTPAANDGNALGAATLSWADVFLASGGVINWNNGDVTLTHSADTLTLGGGDLALGANNLTMTGSLSATGARVTKGWFTDIESTNAPSIGGVAATGSAGGLVRATSPTLVTPILGAASATSMTMSGRIKGAKGADVAAANDLTLGADGNFFIITGATTINAITTSSWQAGSVVILNFSSTPTVKNNTAGGAGTATLLLATGADFAAAANDTLTLAYNGTNWVECARSAN